MVRLSSSVNVFHVLVDLMKDFSYVVVLHLAEWQINISFKYYII